MLACVIWAWLTKKQMLRKRLLVTAVVLFLVFSNYWLFSVCVRAWQPKVEHAHYNTKYSAGIVLCGMTSTDKKEGSFFGNNSDRFLQTLRLYKTGVINKIFVSGGDGSLLQNKPKEADFLYKEFLAMGVPDSALIVEHNSRNTYESAVMAKHYLDSLKIPQPYLVITSAEHIPRSLLCFAKAGMQVQPHAADYKVVNSNLSFADYVFPNVGVLSQWRNFIKEIVGTVVYKVTGKA